MCGGGISLANDQSLVCALAREGVSLVPTFSCDRKSAAYPPLVPLGHQRIHLPASVHPVPLWEGSSCVCIHRSE